MLRVSLSAVGLAAAVLAGPAAAQVLGGNVAGGVTGNVGVQTPPLGQATTPAQDAIRGAGQATRDTLRDAGELARDAAPSAQVETGAQVDAQMHGNQTRGNAQAGAEVSAGAMVHGPDGRMLGQVTDVARDAAGRVEGYVVRTADGAQRTLPAASASVQGGAVVASEGDLR